MTTRLLLASGGWPIGTPRLRPRDPIGWRPRDAAGWLPLERVGAAFGLGRLSGDIGERANPSSGSGLHEKKGFFSTIDISLNLFPIMKGKLLMVNMAVVNLV